MLHAKFIQLGKEGVRPSDYPSGCEHTVCVSWHGVTVQNPQMGSHQAGTHRLANISLCPLWRT